MYTQRTFVLKNAEAEQKWYVIDAADQVVGRLATQVAELLRGKNKPTYTPNTDSGDFVVVVNADKVKFTGNKLFKKKYYSHSGWVSGLKERTAEEQLDKFPDRVLRSAVKGMVPGTALGRQQLKKLKIFTGPEHTHDAQKPEVFKLR